MDLEMSTVIDKWKKLEDKKWEYKGYKLLIEHDMEDDCIKAYHVYYPIDNKEEAKVANITPYDSNARTFQLFIDCIEAGADPKGSHVRNINGTAMYTINLCKIMQLNLL